MTLGLVAVHYPKADRVDELVDRVRAAAAVLVGVSGCLEATCWRESGGAVLTIGKWESEDAMKAGFAAVTAAGIDFEYDAREARPRDVFRMVGT